MGILEPPEDSGPVGGFVWFLVLLITLPVILISVPVYYVFKNKKEISEKVKEFEDKGDQREIHSDFQWRAILRGLTILYGVLFSISGVLLGIVSVLYNVETPKGMTGASFSMEQSIGIFLISIVILVVLVNQIPPSLREKLLFR